MEIGKETVDELKHGHRSVGTTRVQLTSLDFNVYKGVLLRCPSSADPVANTAPVWVGGPGVSANSAEGTGGIPILPGDSLFIPIDKPNRLWVVSSALNQDVAWMGI